MGKADYVPQVLADLGVDPNGVLNGRTLGTLLEDRVVVGAHMGDRVGEGNVEHAPATQ